MSGRNDCDPRRFDAGFYLSEYPEVALSGLGPKEHYDRKGWLEGKDPSPYFSTAAYLEAYPDIRDARINPFEHFVNHGFGEGRAAGLARSMRSDLERRLDALLAAESGLRDSTMASDSGAPPDPAALLLGSRWFAAGHYARAAGAEGDRVSLVAHYLDAAPAARVCPSPDFDPDFYRAAYPDCGADPLLDFLAQGLWRHRYPNALRFRRDARLVREGSGFNRDVYARTLRGKPRHRDPVEDYLLHGRESGALPEVGFDAGFVARTCLDRTGILAVPYVHLVRNRARPWVFAGLDELNPDYEAVAASPLFDAGFYAEAAGIDGGVVDPALHYILRGVPLGLPASPDFHTGLYLERNPDLRAARINPLLHYERHGRAEGRVAVPERRLPKREALVRPGGLGFRPGLPGAIVVSHEASRTGAPIVALNIVRALSATHNIITWLGKDGPLGPAFRAASAAMIGEFLPPEDAARLVADLRDRHALAFAIVNSALSGVALEPLRLAGLPSILLVHDFATYVYPRGSLSRLALNAHLAVFPAEIVRAALEDELDLLGFAGRPATLRIAHQGHNGTDGAEPAALTREKVLARIGVGPETDRGRLRILFGGGWVQPRKGVDLFVQAADRLAREGRFDWRFVWVGGNYKPEEDMMVSAYLADHVEKAGLAGRLHFFEEQPDLEPFWDIADVFFLSSRLDPYPNIALDALMRDVPLVCFEGSTGVAELAGAFGFAVRTAPYADAADAAAAISDLAGAIGEVRARFRTERGALERELSFETYVGRLKAFAETARADEAACAARMRVLAERPEAEVAEAVQRIPAWARLSASPAPAAQRLTLAAMLASGGPAPGLRIAPGEPVEIAGPADPLTLFCPSVPGPAPGPGDLLVHLRATEAGALKAALDRTAAEGWTLVASGLPDKAASGLRVVPGDHDDPFDALAAAVEACGAAHVVHADLALSPPGHLDLLLDADVIGAALAAGPWAAAFPDPGPVFRSRRIAARIAAAGFPVSDGPHPPLFAGIFARQVLLDFLRETAPAYRELRPGLSPAGAATLRAALFGGWSRRAGLRSLLLRAPDAGLLEEGETGMRMGLPEGRGAAAAQATLPPVVGAGEGRKPPVILPGSGALARTLRALGLR